MPEWLSVCGGCEVLSDAGESMAGDLARCSWVRGEESVYGRQHQGECMCMLRPVQLGVSHACFSIVPCHWL